MFVAEEGDKARKSISFRRLDRVCKISALRQGEIVVIQMFLAGVLGQKAGRQGRKGETKPVARAYGLM